MTIDSDNHLAIRKRQLQYRSRRGLLELDCLLSPFIHSQLLQLDVHEVEALECLLALEDPTLLQVLMVEDAQHPQATLIHEIMEASKNAFYGAVNENP